MHTVGRLTWQYSRTHFGHEHFQIHCWLKYVTLIISQLKIVKLITFKYHLYEYLRLDLHEQLKLHLFNNVFLLITATQHLSPLFTINHFITSLITRRLMSSTRITYTSTVTH